MKSEPEAEGKKGGVVLQVYITAFLAPEGVSLLQLAGGTHAPLVVRNEETGYITCNGPTAAFFADAPADFAKEAVAELKPSSAASTETPCSASGIADPAVDGKRVFVMAMNDLAVPPPVQEMVLKGSGLDWEVVKIESGHCPMVSQPEALAKTLVNVAEKIGM